MRKLRVCFSFVFVAVVAMGLAACGDDDSDLSSRADQQPDDVLAPIDDQSDSTVDSLTEDEPENRLNEKENAGKNSSSSKKTSSSSSKKASSSSGKKTGSSSSESKSSDSGKDTESSSSESSSSDKEASSSSTVSSSSTPLSFSVGDDRSVYDAANNTLTDYRDGQIYRTVTIGEQIWMAENLNYAYLVAKDSLDSSSFCYNDSVSHCEKYGRLYQWSAAMDSVGTWSANGMGCGYGTKCSPTYPVRGVCPEGWHLPDTTEWKTLFTAVSVQVSFQSTSSKVLRSTSGWKDHLGENGNGTDVYAFSALPAGRRYNNGVFDYEGIVTHFWNSSQSDNMFFAYTLILDNGNDCRLMYYSANYAYSVRCLKD